MRKVRHGIAKVTLLAACHVSKTARRGAPGSPKLLSNGGTDLVTALQGDLVDGRGALRLACAPMGWHGAKIPIRWIEKYASKVPKFVDRREPVDLEWKSPC